jgi:hypothetical protein
MFIRCRYVFPCSALDSVLIPCLCRSGCVGGDCSTNAEVIADAHLNAIEFVELMRGVKAGLRPGDRVHFMYHGFLSMQKMFDSFQRVIDRHTDPSECVWRNYVPSYREGFVPITRRILRAHRGPFGIGLQFFFGTYRQT